MTRQASYMPWLRARSGASNQKAWRGKEGWKEYLAAKAKLAGASTIKSATGTGANRSILNRLGHLFGWYGPSAIHKIANIEMDKGGGRVGRAHGGRVGRAHGGRVGRAHGGGARGVGKAKRGFGRAMRKK